MGYWMSTMRLVCSAIALAALAGSACASVCPAITKAEQQTFLAVTPEEGGYVIGPGDALAIEVWQNQQLTRLVRVRPDGKITLPLVNDVPAAGDTVPKFQAKLTERLKTFLKEPIVSITVTGFSTKRIYMQGALQNPAAFDYRGDMSLLQAIAQAGGPTPFAEGAAIIVRRKGEQHLRYCVPTEPLMTGMSMKNNIKLQPNDVVTVK